MENANCAKCGDLGTRIRIVADDEGFSSVLYGCLCNPCYLSLLDTIWEMMNE